MTLPREIWEMILRVKTKRAVRERLERILEFPLVKKIFADPILCYHLSTESHHWLIHFDPLNIHHSYLDRHFIVQLDRLGGEFVEELRWEVRISPR